MATTVHDILRQLRQSALSESDKGSRFERLIKSFLLTDRVYSHQFVNVWLWSEWPGNKGQHDTGIDLIAEDRTTGAYVAIQCKFYAPTTTISKPMIDSFLAASGKEGFTQRIIVTTTDSWNLNAEEAIKDQSVSVRRISLSDLENSGIDWSLFSIEQPEQLVLRKQKQLLPHQNEAIDSVLEAYATNDRGKLIMACGTGKTFTSLRLAEQLCGAGSTVLFLVPSISLLSQTVREWVDSATVDIAPLAVCSDPKATRGAAAEPGEDISTTDIALPATTNIAKLQERIAHARSNSEAMTVVFSTYQSIDVVAQAQDGTASSGYDLIIADEAHRTTGVTLAGASESSFVRVHNNEYIAATKRLYMTATPRLYDDSTRARAGEADALICSMDDESFYGPEFFRLGFGEAVDRDLLTDYKVLVLAVDESAIAQTFQQQLSNDDHELQLDDAAKIVGCWNGLAKRGSVEHSFAPDLTPMRRAVAFAGTIKDSKRIELLFNEVVRYYTESEPANERPFLNCEVQHVDGTFNALERNSRIDWLKRDTRENTCRILTNARCLSEGVDIPALDSVMFLSPRKSVVDIVQSVGRVMRKADGKDFGYIILPIGIPAGVPPETALEDNTRYAAVWEVLQALRAHDERFDAMVNRIDLTSERDRKINVIGVGGGLEGENPGGEQGTLNLVFGNLDIWRDAIYSKIVTKVGTRRYWSEWARSVAEIANRQITRIQALLADPAVNVRPEFESFLDGLRGNLNEGISEGDAIDMLAQHMITRPIFNALFEGYDFLDHNPVAQTMERMLVALDQHNLEDENATLEKFYNSVRMRVSGIDTAEGRQRIIVELYDTFFSAAFKKTVEKLGIVYTPVEIVDFIIQSAQQVLKNEFDESLTGQGVHILDGFTGTGTFIVRLLQSGLIESRDLLRKYSSELHANEILLLAYYIAAVNIEATFQDLMSQAELEHDYQPFPGLVLTDTFQSWEDDDRQDLDVFPENNERLERLKELPITVILGNPPYSAKQSSANDDNANVVYAGLDEAIRGSYAARSEAKNKNSLYDSYLRAIKWATLRIRDRGVIAFVTNSGFLTRATSIGVRQTLEEEFTSIYILNLRGNQKSGDWRKEGGKIFGAGSQAGVAITLLVRNPVKTDGPTTIQYYDIGDFLTREEKLLRLRESHGIDGISFEPVEVDGTGQWIERGTDEFATFMPLLDSKQEAVGVVYANGIGTSRDAWVYGFSSATINDSMQRSNAAYQAALNGERTNDSKKIKWSSSLEASLNRSQELSFADDDMRSAVYRPFQRTLLYKDLAWVHRPRIIREFFPTADTPNVGFYLPGVGATKPFSVLMVDAAPDLNFWGSEGGQFFARWRYESFEDSGMLEMPLVDDEVIDGYRRVDNVSDEALSRFTRHCGDGISRDDIFYYVYGLLHSEEYRSLYQGDLRSSLPRIPIVEDWARFVEAGRELANLHLSYETVDPAPLVGMEAAPQSGDPYEFYRVQKMKFPRHRVDGKAKADYSTLIYNSNVTLYQIPETAYEYRLGARSALEWIVERYQVHTDSASGIVNDPNDWSRSTQNPRYILDLIGRIVSVSLRTQEIVAGLPGIVPLAANQG